MATSNHEKYSRLVLMLVNGGTKITRALFEKLVKERTPKNHGQSPWTVDEFLHANKQKVIGTQTGRSKERTFFPGASGTNMEHWDLYMFCFVLIEVCGVTDTVRMDVCDLRKLRNKLCHLREPSIDNDKYDHYVVKISVIYKRLLTEIDDQNLKEEIDAILEAAKHGPLSLPETLNVMHKFYSMEEETREMLSQQSKETFVELLVKNCVSDKEMFLSKLLVSMYKDATGRNTSSGDELSPDSYNKLMEAVRDTVEKFASQDRSVTDAEQKCIVLRIQCTSVASLLSLFNDCIEGELNQEFRPLEATIRQIKGFEEVSIEAVVYEDEFWKSINKIVSSLEEVISRTYSTVFQSRAETQNGEIHGITDVNLVERLSPTTDDERRTQHAVRLTIKTDFERQEHLRNAIKSGSFDSSINRLREAIVKQYDLTNLSIEARIAEKDIGTNLQQKSEDYIGKKKETESHRYTLDESQFENFIGRQQDHQDQDLSHLSLEKYLVRERSSPSSSATIIHRNYSSFTNTVKDSTTSLSPGWDESSLLLDTGYFKEQKIDRSHDENAIEPRDVPHRREHLRRGSFDSISTTRDSGIGIDIAETASVSDTFSNVYCLTNVLPVDTDDLSSNDINISDNEDIDRGQGNGMCVPLSFHSHHDKTVDADNAFSGTKSDESLIKHGIQLNESYLARIKAKSSKAKTYYQKFLDHQQLKEKLRQNHKKYVSCVLHLEGSHEAYCTPILDCGHLHRIYISGRSKIGQTYNEDEVVVEILDNKHKYEKRYGKVLGVLKRHRCKGLKHPVFLCTPDETESHIVRPMCKTVPKINILQEEIRIKSKTRRAMRFKIDIYDYDEHAGILHSPRTETLSRGDIQSCVFLVALISWESNQLYPKGAILKRFPCGENLATGLEILNLRYEISQHFSKQTVEEVESLSERVRTTDKVTESELQGDNIHDMTNLRTFTFDRHDSKDLNYAFSIQQQDGCFKIGVHISDVSQYITKGSPIDDDAFQRAMTICSDVDTPRYMLPDQIALELCSLLEAKKRPVISVYLFLNEYGRQIQTHGRNFSIEKSFISCCKNLSYKEAQQRIKDRSNNDVLTNDLKRLFWLMSRERKNRLGKAIYALRANEIEMDTSVIGCLEAHCLTEELVVLANQKVSDVLYKHKLCLPLLNQSPPSKRDLETFQKKYGSYLGVSVHFQNPQNSAFPNETLENVLQTNPQKELMVTEPIWNAIKSSSESSVETILYDNFHPIQCIIYQEWLSIQGRHFYTCSSIGHNVTEHPFGPIKYAQCTAPTRRYTDLVVQRLIHCFLDKVKHGNFYSRSDIEKVCSRVNHVLNNVQGYQSDCRNLKKATQLRNRPKIQSCFVRSISDSCINVVYPDRMYFGYQDIELPFKLLDIGFKPEISENRNTQLQQVTGKWRKRFYDTKAMPLMEKNTDVETAYKADKNDLPKPQKVQILNHNKDLLFIRLYDWATLIVSALDNRVKDLRHKISRLTVKAYDKGENDISTECSEINSYTVFSYIFHTGQPLKIQLSAESKDGIIAPKPVLYEMSESITLCLQHLDDPVLHLSQYATCHARDQYESCIEYRETWLPIVSMEAAVGATSNEDNFSIRNVEIEIIDKTRGRFMLPVIFCSERNIGFSGVYTEDTESIDEDETRFSYDWLCIKRKVLETHMAGTKRTDYEYHWVGHAEITDVQKKRKSNRLLIEQNYIITFELHARSDTFPKVMKNKGKVKCHVEVLRKTEVDRRIESHLKIFQTKGHHLAVQIALKRNQNVLDFERRQISNSIERDLFIFSTKDDPRKRPLPRNNVMQQKAIDTALHNKFTLVQGPPGTGKTYTGIKLIYLFNKINNILYKRDMKLKKHVLFCGPSNKSVDLVGKWMLRRLGDLCPDFVRVYGKATESLDYPIPGISFNSKGSSIHRADEELRNVSLHHLIRSKDNVYAERINAMEGKFREENRRPDPEPFLDYLDVLRSATDAEIRKHDVILCTTGVASNPKILRAAGVYQIIVDEAGMCSEPQCMIPLLASKAEQVVLIGDHKQLRPIVKCSTAAELGLDKSLFERYATTKDIAAPFVMLEEQYRMNPSLCDFPSQEFYNGRLHTNNGPWQYETLDIWPTDNNGMPYTHVLIHVGGEENVLPVSTAEGNEQSKSNSAEIKIVVKMYRYLIKENVPASAINIISQYNAQCAEIKEELRKECFENYLVNTVVSSQGGEWDYVIFSTVRSLPDYKIEPNPTLGWCKHNLGFITDKNQINVALTRAKRVLLS